MSKDEETTGDRTATTSPDVEQDIGNALLGENETPTFVAPVCITFHCTRARLADIDGLSGKACIDGIVSCGVLSDDSAQQVQTVSYTQTKGKPEKTVIVIEEVES